MSIYLITKTDSNNEARRNEELFTKKIIGYKTSHSDSASYLNDRSKEKKYPGWANMFYPQYEMHEIYEIDTENNLVMSDGNKIMAKLLDQFGKGVYTILSYDLVDHITHQPSAVIEHEDGTPTSIYYDKEKGEWR